MTPQAHAVLRTSAGGELVVAADFGTSGRPSATFGDLVANLTADRTIWETLPPPYGPDAALTAAQHIERWMADIVGSGLSVTAVIGFCSGSVYAAALADALSARQPAPRLLLIDPDLAQRRMVIEHYERFVRARLSAVATPGEVDAAAVAGRRVDAGAASAVELAAGLDTLCRTIMAPTLIRGGLGARRSRELSEVFASYLYWLAAGSDVDPRTTWRRGTALNSQTEGFGLHAFPAEQRATLFRRVIDFDLPHLELMRSPCVAQTVDDWLASTD